MKKYFLLFLLVLIVTSVSSQNKPKQKEKPPTQKEMEAMMKEMQQTMNEMSPEEKRAMDSMGIKIPSLKNVPKMSDKQLADAFEEENRMVPKKDVARISSIPKAITDSKMQSYLTAIQSKLSQVFKPEVVSAGNEAYNYIKSKSKNVNEAANMAMGLWIGGKPEIALYVLGKICVTDDGNTDNLSNYSAMLSMLGAQHLAIPILNNLNAKYPKNSTLLNNLGQAWFGLGEIGKAEKYLDSTIRIYAYHPQANMTKSLIEESKGNIPKAIEAAKKSISKAFSSEKVDRLKKLGYSLNPGDIAWDPPMPQDALGLGKFTWPEYPMDVEQNDLLKKEWDVFKNECQQQIDELNAKREKAEQNYFTQSTLRQQLVLQASQKGQFVPLIPGYAAKAIQKLGPGVSDINGTMSFVFSEDMKPILTADKMTETYQELLEKKQKALDIKYKDKIGEGRENPFEAVCKDENEIRTEFLKNANGGLANANKNYFNYARRRTSDLLYYYQYTMWPEQFELAKVNAQIAWLTQLKNQKVMFKDKSSWCQAIVEKKLKPSKLQAFDDVACQYKSKMNLVIITFENNCSHMTSEFDFMFLKYVRKDDFERAEGDTYISSTLKISAEAGKDLKAGPLKVEAKIGAGIEFEFGRAGIEDVTFIGEAKVGAGTNVLDENKEKESPGIGLLGKDAFPTTVEAGIEGRISIISGHVSGSGTGVLSGVKIPGL